MSFPATSILDDFNRANNAANLGGSWVITGFSNGGINANQLYNPSSGDNLVAFFGGTNYGPDCEASILFPTFVSGTYLIYARATNTSIGAETSYAIRWLSSTNTQLIRLDAGVPTVIASGFNAMANGYGLGVEVLGSGASVAVNGYLFNGTSWSNILSGNDTDANRITVAGKIGLFAPADTTFRLDDFRGGTLGASGITSTQLLRGAPRGIGRGLR